ncbi:MAG: hypothetical protein ACP5RP_00010 [Candidatus Micrarchaeia archaeon]
MAPAHTALVIWDVQKMLVESVFNKQEFLSNLQMLIESARVVGIPMFLL